MSEEPGAETAAARARARRAAALRLHPDRGGDAASFDRAMRSFETTAPAPSGPSEPPAPTAAPAPRRAEIVVKPRTRAARAAATVRTTSTSLVADVRRRLPRSFPGSRRYGRL